MADTAKCFIVRNAGEYGSFYLREGVEGDGEHQNYWCELTCNTSFGTVGYYWSSMGGPAAWFLNKIDNGYLIGKLWMGNSSVLDVDKALKQLRAEIIKERKAGDLTKENARDRWNDLSGCEDSELEFNVLVRNTDWLWSIMTEGGGNYGQTTNQQAIGFCRDLWPSFLEQLKADVEASKEPTCVS